MSDAGTDAVATPGGSAVEWVHWAVPGFAIVGARVCDDPDGRLVVGELWIRATDGQPITAPDLRRIRLGEFERLINQPETAEAIRRSWADHVAPPPIVQQDAMQRKHVDLKVAIPEGRRRPDTFYERVATLFDEVAMTNERAPAVALAEANGVPPSTVHRWIKEARRRGLAKPPRRRRS